MFKLVVFFAFLAVVLGKEIGPEIMAKIEKTVKECQSDSATKVTGDAIDKFFNGEKTDDPQVARFFVCYAKKLDFFKDDKLNVDYVKGEWAKFYSAEQMAKLTPCLVDKATIEETIMHLFTCKRGVTGLSKVVLDMVKANA